MKCLVGVALAFAFILTGCDKPKVSCSDEKAKSVIRKIVVDEAEKEIATVKDKAGGAIFDAAKVRATINQIKISIDNIRTTKQDPNSTKIFCEGNMTFTVPAEILSNAEKGAELAKIGGLSRGAKEEGFERSADLFSRNVSYTAQPTDDGQNTYAELESYTKFRNMMALVVTTSLMKPMLEEKAKSEAKMQAEQAAEQARLQVESEKQQTEQKRASLGLAKTENAIATQQINEVWKSLTDFKQKTLLEYQRAWIKKKEIDCKVMAAGKTVDPTEKETHRLTCDTEVTKIRTAQLRQYM